MSIKLFDSELHVMQTLWKHGPLSAKQIAGILSEEIGWNVNTTYTVIKKCIAKGAIARQEPNFTCVPLVGKEQIQQSQSQELIDKLFDGSKDLLLCSLLGGKALPKEHLERLRQMIDAME